MVPIQDKEISLVAGGMGSRGYVNPNQNSCNNAVIGGFVGGGIAGLRGGLGGMALGAIGGGIAGFISSCQMNSWK